MRKRFNLLPTYHFEENTNGQIRGAAERVLRDCTIYGNCGRNLISYPYLMTTKTENGITFTDNGDGTVTVDGTATADATFRMSYFTVKKGVTYYLSGCPKGGSRSTFYFWLRGYDVDIGNGLKIAPTYDFTNNFEIVIKQGAVVNNLIFKPQFEIGETATDYELYKAVGNMSKNLISYPYSMSTTTRSGITFTDNGDGTVTANGTATASAAFVCKYYNAKTPIVPDKKVYYLSGCPDGGRTSASVWNYRINAQTWKGSSYVNGYSDFGDGITVDLRNVDFDALQVQILINEGTTVENLIFKPQLELGDSATEFEPYGKYVIPVTVSGKNVFNWDAVSTVQDVIAPNTSSLTILDNGAIIKGLSNPTIGIASAYSNGWFRPGISTDTHNRGSFYVKKGCSVQITADVRLIELSENYTDNNYTNIYLYGTEPYTLKNSSVTLPTDGTVKRVSMTYNVKMSGMYYPVFTLNSNTLEITNIQCTIKCTDGTWDSEDYEPYTAPKTTNLLLDAPLGPGESISCREKGLLVPELATIDPNITNYITFGSEVKPSSAKFYYYKY